ncbi:MAG: chromosome segregation protein SMC [Clostridia bacterium]|nr:chromosome segregation protein SMC [Clostridia bacterium]
MRTFKEIQLVGFKSFADKTVIPISDGVTGIVGPNGCGKSNVADAIRWVLGEQSAKNMRGSHMMDVIFDGTETRRKTSMCEVTLLFDNTSRVFDMDSDEVEMTRRLYRDGTSEYVLNKQPSRLKTLINLLHGVGLAKEGYSIIGQGRIEQIMRSKPEDRRSIFEEATGIVVFKDRKNEAERKLQASKDNLFVFEQRMGEVERQIGPLKKAAENAQKYEAIYGELRRNETNLYITRHDSAEGEKDKIRKKKQAADDRVDYLTRHMDDLLAEYGRCREEINTQDNNLNDLNERLNRYSVGIEHKSGEARVYTEKANAAKQKLSQARDDIAFSSKRIADIDKEIRRGEDLQEKNRRRIEKMRLDATGIKAKADDLSAKIAQHELDTGEHRKKLMAAMKDLSDLRQNMGSIAAQKELLSERVGEMQTEMESIHAKYLDSKAQYDQCLKRFNELNQMLSNEDSMTEAAKTALAEWENKLSLLTRQEYDANAQLSALEQKLDTYVAIRERYDGYGYSVKNLMTDAKSHPEVSERIEGLIADIITCQKDCEVAIETAFGGAMNNIITRTRDDARYLIEYLKASRLGQVTFLPMDGMKARYENDQIRSAVKDRGAIGFAIDLVKFDRKYENVIHYLLGNTLVVDNIASATAISRRYPRAFRIVTLDGDQIATSGSMTGGYKKNSGNLLLAERQIKDLEGNISQTKGFLSRVPARRKEYTEARDKAQADLDNVVGGIQAARLELAGLSEKQTTLLQNISSQDSEYEAYQESVSILQSRLKGLDSEYSGISSGADELTKVSDQGTETMDTMDSQYAEMKTERDSLTDDYNTLNVNMASLESTIKGQEDNVESLKKERDAHYRKIDEINASIPQIQDELSMFSAQAEKTALTEEEQAVVADLRKQIQDATAAKKTVNERIQAIDAERLSSQQEKEEKAEASHSYELSMAKIDSDLEYLKTRIDEEYGLDYEGCLVYKDPDFTPSTANSAIANCKRQITMLGPINFNAVQEYADITERYSQMQTEKEDLEKAIADLQVALDDIRAEMLRIFNEGFDLINENFKRTFKELFGGGKAELQLDYTDCEDPLEAGVEIIASPPGKKLSKISLLSGGEQALTSIAILFAIIATHPMPFCVLDEIEAALDEANVSRFARYLKKFSQGTQFLVITHKKPTMEEANALLGVTMEEKGVSKIVTVKLSEVEHQFGAAAID